jgi:hypothetical protein
VRSVLDILVGELKKHVRLCQQQKDGI